MMMLWKVADELPDGDFEDDDDDDDDDDDHHHNDDDNDDDDEDDDEDEDVVPREGASELPDGDVPELHLCPGLPHIKAPHVGRGGASVGQYLSHLDINTK